MNNQKNGGEAGQNSTGQTGRTRREFLGKITKSLIGGGVLITALTKPQMAKAIVCTECDGTYNECYEDTCDAVNICGTDACSEQDTCTSSNTCTSTDNCELSNTCNPDACVTVNSCQTDQCDSGDTCSATTDTCDTDICSNYNVCVQENTCWYLNWCKNYNTCHPDMCIPPGDACNPAGDCEAVG
jgi:hypothetical protein